VADAPNAGEVAALGQAVVDDDRVDGCAIEVAGTDRLEDRLVGGPVEVPGVLDDLGDVGDGVARQQHRAEGAHLRGEALGRRGSFRLVVVVGHLVLPFLRSAPVNWATVVPSPMREAVRSPRTVRISGVVTLVAMSVGRRFCQRASMSSLMASAVQSLTARAPRSSIAYRSASRQEASRSWSTGRSVASLMS